MKYMLIHCVDETAEHSAEGIPTFDSWLAEMLGRGVTLHGDRLRDVSDATTVQVRDREVLVSDGPFAETKDQIGGYDVIECASLDEAIEVAAAHPLAQTATVEVRPFDDFPWPE